MGIVTINRLNKSLTHSGDISRPVDTSMTGLRQVRPTRQNATSFGLTVGSCTSFRMCVSRLARGY